LEEWYADSGATQHMSGRRALFNNFIPVKDDTWFVNGIGGSRLQVHGHHGEVLFTATVNGFTIQQQETSNSKEFTNLLLTETGQLIFTLRADNGGELTGQTFRTWMSKKGIGAETSAPNTPE
jgi:hypothetical protein